MYDDRKWFSLTDKHNSSLNNLFFVGFNFCHPTIPMGRIIIYELLMGAVYTFGR